MSSIDSSVSLSSNSSMNSISIPLNDSLLELVKNKNKELLKTDTMEIFDTTCLRKKTNLNQNSSAYKFDSGDFNPSKLLNNLEIQSPKLDTLLKQIEKLDKSDMQKHGKLFKHFIFSEIKIGSYGAKLISSALIAKGMKLGYTADIKNIKINKKVVNDSDNDVDNDNDDNNDKNGEPKEKNKITYGKINFISNEVLLNNRNNNFYLLSSTNVFNQSISVELKQNILKNFNKRPDNIHGELARIIVMDSGYKEGIDLFDIKYIHIFEPMLTDADHKQVIGRGTRRCGQKGLVFHPTQGWKLNVYIYDLIIPEQLSSSFVNSTSAFDLYLKTMNIDFRLLNFQHDLENVSIQGSVDYDLNHQIHHFMNPNDIDNNEVGGGPKRRKRFIIQPDPLNTNLQVVNELIRKENQPDLYIQPHSPSSPPVLASRLHYNDMKEYIQTYFKNYEWKNPKVENLCVYKNETATKTQIENKPELVSYTSTQEFIRHFFTPENPIKGMLLYHSVGTGKTCTAIASATTTFEKQGYTILWVTKTTLKNDIWKNMFEQVCNETIRNKLINNEIVIPKENAKRMRLLSKSWSIRPMSYKQFTNLVSKENKMYQALVKKNGATDPLQKTLLIIDEAHKLYSEIGGMSTLEKPNMKILHETIMNSYNVSGVNSVKLLLMTATPITNNPMELIKLLNLCKPFEEQMPTIFEDFSDKYLNEQGTFSNLGKSEYLNDIAGYISYLNREKDIRQFAQPVIKYIYSPIIKNTRDISKYDKQYTREYLESEIPVLKEQLKDSLNKLDSDLGDLDMSKFGFLKNKCSQYEGKAKTQCTKIVNKQIKELLKEAKLEVKEIRDNIKQIRENIKNKNLLKKTELSNIKENISIHPEEFNTFKKSMYYKLKYECGKKITQNADLNQIIENHSDIKVYSDKIREYDDNISNIQFQVSNRIQTYKNRIKQLKDLLRTELSELERNVVKMNIATEQTTQRNLMAKGRKYVKQKIVEWTKTKKTIQKDKNKHSKRLKTKLKEVIQNNVRLERDIKLREKELNKTLRKQGNYSKKIENQRINNLVDKYSEIIDNDILAMKEELDNKNAEVLRVKQIKEDRKLEQMEKKQKREEEKQRKNDAKTRKKEMNPTKTRKPITIRRKPF